ncbi:MAG: superfamily domain protein [Firmicutes bacterium]|nr:superfamily domain protein [Bacillota bacterium]
MAADTLLTPEEVAQILKLSRFTVYELIKHGDIPVYRIGRSMRIAEMDLKKYMQNSKRGDPALSTPESSHFARNNCDKTPDLIICGQDAMLDVLSSHIEPRLRNGRVLRRYIGSIGGLTALYNRTINIATAHLWDGDSGEYNVPYIRSYLPGCKAVVVNLVYRTEGFYVSPGNPKKIIDWTDLVRQDLRFVNRERGSGARVLLDEMLRKLDIDCELIHGYDHEEMNHLSVAGCVARGDADVGLGTEKTTQQVRNVDFIPLQKERYDMIIFRQDAAKPEFQLLLAILRSPEFRKEIESLGGYDISQMGEIMAEI